MLKGGVKVSVALGSLALARDGALNLGYVLLQ
jgi:hypothetical protein